MYYESNLLLLRRTPAARVDGGSRPEARTRAANVVMRTHGRAFVRAHKPGLEQLTNTRHRCGVGACMSSTYSLAVQNSGYFGVADGGFFDPSSNTCGNVVIQTEARTFLTQAWSGSADERCAGLAWAHVLGNHALLLCRIPARLWHMNVHRRSHALAGAVLSAETIRACWLEFHAESVGTRLLTACNVCGRLALCHVCLVVRGFASRNLMVAFSLQIASPRPHTCPPHLRAASYMNDARSSSEIANKVGYPPDFKSEPGYCDAIQHHGGTGDHVSSVSNQSKTQLTG